MKMRKRILSLIKVKSQIIIKSDESIFNRILKDF